MARALAFLAFLAAATLNIVAQSASPDTIRGTVVAEETGQIISNARIRDDDNPDAAGAATDATGRFVLGPSSARHHVSVAKSGFLNAAATAEDGVEIHLTRGVAITGRVFDDLGEPLPLMNVAARRQRRKSRSSFGGLPPGDFYVAALDRPRNLDDPQSQDALFFESLIASATRVTLAPREHRSISVSVTGR